jgi:transcriptional regulator with XRE-family HTH domain
MTQRELEEAADVAENSVSRFENGRHMRLDILSRLLAALGADLCDLGVEARRAVEVGEGEAAEPRSPYHYMAVETGAVSERRRLALLEQRQAELELRLAGLEDKGIAGRE